MWKGTNELYLKPGDGSREDIYGVIYNKDNDRVKYWKVDCRSVGNV